MRPFLSQQGDLPMLEVTGIWRRESERERDEQERREAEDVGPYGDVRTCINSNEEEKVSSQKYSVPSCV